MNMIEARTAEYLNTFLGKEGFQLMKTEYLTEDGIRYLRVFLDLTEEEQKKRGEEGSVGINDCAAVSRRLSKWLDKEDFIPEEYMLEVCSKGYMNDVPDEAEEEAVEEKGDKE